MRRKSERNKAKGPSEKTIEKATPRRTTRRRGKLSPANSPEPENSEDHVTSTPISDEDKEPQIQPEEQNNDINDEQRGISSTELIKSVLGGEEEDNGSVWKVARADASPGEIQKLKLCRQRNISEASDGSQCKKISNKWPESGEGVTEEAESVDEQIVSSEKMTVCGEIDDTSSLHPGQESHEEVSDYKENLPETTSANLSDDQTNIDQQAVCQESLPETNYSEQPTNEDSQFADTSIDNSHKDQMQGRKDILDAAENSTSEPQNEEHQDDSSGPDFKNTNSTENEDNLAKVSSKVDDDSCKNFSLPEISQGEEELTVNENVAIDQDENTVEDTFNEETPKENCKSEQETPLSDDKNTELLTIETETVDTILADNQNNEDKDYEEEEGEIREDAEEERSPESHCYRKDHSNERRQLSRQRMNENHESELDLSEISIDKEDILEINEKTDDLNVTLSSSKPAKVSLKRSFSARLSTDLDSNKEENHDKSSNSIQNKENHADNDQPDQKATTKRRRWGITVTSDVAPAFSISTDSLKALVPGAKPVPENEVRLTKDDEGRERRKSKHEITEHKSKNDTVSKSDTPKKEQKTENHIGAKRKISTSKEAPRPTSPSPAEAQATKILLIKNLVRPFTLNQIKELLSRTGTIVENGFWMDRIKSKCFVEYANEDQAFETRQALHGISWPLSNPKKLIVEYAKKEDMEKARETLKDQPISKKSEQLVSDDLWPQEKWAREERNNVSNKITVVREWDLGKEDGLHDRKQKERKEPEKKKRQRSVSPMRETHLPAPARKFKKKEEEPPTAKLLDDLFRKTKSTPCIYWLPLTNEQIMVKEEMRRQHMAEHARRLEEMRRVERSRDTRRRSRPRK